MPNNSLYAEIRINAKDTPLFIQFWPEQYFGYATEPITYSPALVINYAKHGVVRLCTFNSDIKQIILNPDQAPLPDSIHFPFPEMVTIEAKDRIQVILAKQLFTRTGGKKLK